MKKIMSVILVFVMTMLIGLTGCDFKIPGGDKDNPAQAAEVKLVSISAAASDTATHNIARTAFFATGDASDETASGEDTGITEPGDSNDNEESEIAPELERDYTVIYKSQTLINFTINLSNPKNHFIMDFRLECSTSDAVKVRLGSKYWNINDEDTYIRWDDAIDKSGNRQATFELELPNPEISPDKITVKDMYYSDRTDGTNKTEVNMNNKETYTVYKIEKDPVICETVSNSQTEYKFKMVKKEGVKITKFTCAGDDYMNISADSDGNYSMGKNGKIEIEYEIELAEGTEAYKGKYEKDIELIMIRLTGNLNRINDNVMFINMILSGTESDKISVKNYKSYITKEISAYRFEIYRR